LLVGTHRQTRWASSVTETESKLAKRNSTDAEPHLTKSLSTPTVADKLRELVQSDAKSDLMDFRPEQVNGHWQIRYPLAVFVWQVEKTP
jgi:hypothetical protein